MEVKVCTTCKKEYPATEKYFTKCDENKDKLFSMCKECKNKSLRKSRDKEEVRGKQISVSLTNKEKEIIEGYAKDSNMNTGAYVRNVVLKNAPIIVKDLGNYEKLEDEIEQLSYYLSKVGNNINQIAKNLNAGKGVSASTIEKMTKVMEKLDDRMKNIEGQVCSIYQKWR